MLNSVRDVETRLLNTSYLRDGNSRQRMAADALDEVHVGGLPGVEEWTLAGTVPLGVDLPTSDLDILVYAPAPRQVCDELTSRFFQMYGFAVWVHSRETGAWCVTFKSEQYYWLEFFIQSTPVRQQRAFRHLAAEYSLLEIHGEHLRNRVHRLKAQGLKTEPAFAEALGLEGDPYLALLEMWPA